MWKYVRTFLYITLGSFLYSIALKLFFVTNHLAQGGITGVSLLLHYLFKTPIGLMIILMNIPIFILGYIRLGKGFLLYSAYGMLSVSILIDVTSYMHMEPLQNVILAPIYGGIIGGLGVGLILRVGGTTGGVDIIARVLQTRFRGLEMGKLIAVIDFTIIGLSSFIVGLEKAMLTSVAVYVSSRVVDLILTGVQQSRSVMIVSQKTEEINKLIQKELVRGVTMLHAMGGYTKKEGEVIMVVVQMYELDRLRKLVKEIDSRAFIMVFELKEVIGEGFTTPSPARKHLEHQKV
ncbi:MAG TPA: hypothetical protein DDY49_11000 [Paenibacillaceae bacterium]|nr:hypothetical protein [Paenibacillaceae bacterium]